MKTALASLLVLGLPLLATGQCVTGTNCGTTMTECLTAGPTHCLAECDTCGGSSTITIEIDNARCDSQANCSSGSCTTGSQLRGSATVSISAGTCNPIEAS